MDDLLSRLVTQINGGVDPTPVLDELDPILADRVVPLIDEFRATGRAASPTFCVWDDFLRKVMLPLKLFLYSTRHGDWNVSQSAKAMMLPLLFATNRNIYARYMPYLCLQMMRLPEDVTRSFTQGLFVAKLTRGRFNAQWIDYVLEATENKALKGTGGIIGLTRRGNALARWFLARPISPKYSLTNH